MRWFAALLILIAMPLASQAQAATVKVCGTIVTGGTTSTTSPPCSPQFVGNGRTVSGTTDTLVAADCGTTITYTSSSAVTVSLTASGMPGLWCHIALYQSGTGKVSLSGSGVTLNAPHSCTGTSAQYAFIGASTPDGGTTWILSGDCS